MKQIKRGLALLLVLAMALCLGGCGKFESKMARAARKMSKLESFRMDMMMDMGMSLSMMGETEMLDATVDFTGDVTTEPARAGGTITVDMAGELIEMPFYMDLTEEVINYYFSADEGESWNRMELRPEEYADMGDEAEKPGLSYYAKLAETFTEQGKETVRGSEATVFSGYIPGEELSQSFTQGLELGMSAAAEELDMDLSALDFSEMGDLPVTIAIDDKSGMITRVTMDMSELMQKVMDEVMKLVLAELAKSYGAEDMDLSEASDMISITMDRVELAVELYDFDAVGSIEIPQEALEAELLEAA